MEEEADSDEATCLPCAYAIFLDATRLPSSAPLLERIIDYGIRKLTPRPAVAHVELLLPPAVGATDTRVQFATYLDAAGADWQYTYTRGEGKGYYLWTQNIRWRAMPIFATDVVARARDAAEASRHAPYSLSMYLTSIPPLRAFTPLCGDESKHKGHCAVITARVLKAAGVKSMSYPSAWYSPSTLHATLCHGFSKRISHYYDRRLACENNANAARVCDTLLRSPLSSELVAELGDEQCMDAVRLLTKRVCDEMRGEWLERKQSKDAGAGEAAEGEREPTSWNAQRELAQALFRWVILRSYESV